MTLKRKGSCGIFYSYETLNNTHELFMFIYSLSDPKSKYIESCFGNIVPIGCNI